MAQMQGGFPQQNGMFDFGGSSSQSAGATGNLGQSPQLNNAPVADPFSPSASTQVTSEQNNGQQPNSQSDKPKFVPNPMFQAGMTSNAQQQYMMQMQMQAQ